MCLGGEKIRRRRKKPKSRRTVDKRYKRVEPWQDF